MSSFKNEEQRKKKLGYPGNFEILHNWPIFEDISVSIVGSLSRKSIIATASIIRNPFVNFSFIYVKPKKRPNHASLQDFYLVFQYFDSTRFHLIERLI